MKELMMIICTSAWWCNLNSFFCSVLVTVVTCQYAIWTRWRSFSLLHFFPNEPLWLLFQNWYTQLWRSILASSRQLVLNLQLLIGCCEHEGCFQILGLLGSLKSQCWFEDYCLTNIGFIHVCFAETCSKEKPPMPVLPKGPKYTPKPIAVSLTSLFSSTAKCILKLKCQARRLQSNECMSEDDTTSWDPIWTRQFVIKYPFGPQKSKFMNVCSHLVQTITNWEICMERASLSLPWEFHFIGVTQSWW